MDQIKLENFVKKIRRQLKFELNANDIFVYFDDTCWGSGKEGLAITNDHLIGNVTNCWGSTKRDLIFFVIDQD